MLRPVFVLIAASGLALGQTDWPQFGHDPGGTRYSPLKQIDAKNVSNLERAWTYHMKPAGAAVATNTPPEGNEVPPAGANGRGGRGGRGPRAGRFSPSGDSPLIVGGLMFITSPYGHVAALEPETGKEVWVYKTGENGYPAERGLEYWPGDAQSPSTVFFGTDTGKLIALNAKTGKQIPGFGKEGVVDMKPGASNGLSASFGLSSPPIVYKNVLITGAHVQESPSLGSSGDTRAWDVHTGKLLWQFHSIPRPGETGHETWDGNSWENRSGTNVWGMFTIDTQRGILYMPFGEPTSDYWGGDRKGDNLFGTTLVAVDALTGKLKWYFQAVHHDTWDYDLAAPPVLFDVTVKGKKVPALAQLSKMGMLFILNRETGKPIYGVEERKVPVDDALPGDTPSPTQPFPLKPPPLARNSFKREDIVAGLQQGFAVGLARPTVRAEFQPKKNNALARILGFEIAAA